ncbi:MAG: HD domain-containing protein [Chitinivibrionales bacterium]|nr:HD domain-containing protein [Chitinivibrionales bacterium]
MALKKRIEQSPQRSGARPQPDEIYAIIDVGSSSIRMAIQQRDERNDSIRTLDTLEQEVSLGKDTFTKGLLEWTTIEECVTALKNFKRIIDEYHIDLKTHTKAVATNAVREAMNRDAFLDRVYSSTGITIEIIEEADVARYTYLSVQPAIIHNKELRSGRVLVFKVSGGSSELLYIQQARLLYAQPHRLGSFRLRETLEKHGTDNIHLLSIMNNQIQKTVDRITSKLPKNKGVLKIILLGGEIRFAAGHLLPDWEPKTLAENPLGEITIGEIPLLSLTHFTEKIVALSADELVHHYHIPYPEAEVLAPTLLAYCRLASAFHVKQVYCCTATMHNGLFYELIGGKNFNDQFQQQILNCAWEVGRKYEIDQVHSRYVARLCQLFFDALKSEHSLDNRYSIILQVAAILHETGLFISSRSHHKHSLYLILNSDLFGLNAKDQLIAALVARYHRSSTPAPTHYLYDTLDRDGRIVVSKLAAILRIADALDRSNSQRIQQIDVAVRNGKLVITTGAIDDLTLEMIGLKEKGDLFKQVYGLTPVIENGTPRQ